MEEKMSIAQKILELVQKEQQELKDFKARIKELARQDHVFFTGETQDEKNRTRRIISLANRLIELYS